MTDDPRGGPDPLPGSDAAGADPIDERLSAALDGEGDAAVDDVVEASADAERLRALATARDLLASPPPPLDDVTRRRVLDAALAAGTPRRPATRGLGRWSVPAAAAALIAVIALGGWALVAGVHGTGGGSNGSKTASQGAAATTTVPANLDLGDVSKPARLRQQVKSALNGTAADRVAGLSADKNDRVLPRDECKGALRLPAGVTVEVLGRATFHGAAAVVLVGRESARTVVYVLAIGDCRLLSAQFFKG